MGAPPGFLSLLSMIGGTALTSPALATRSLPCRATWRASPPPVANVHGAPQIDRGREFGDIRRISIHVVTEDRMAGPSVASPVMR
jgi:hypothetical protein